ncbi:hypothetical protein BFJ66_g13036 [Fusarium oxysporum f. sp. cepae]|uniref:Uncharacterized protein n=1 Tax=Fusarium oxysporum f. sp. cepae TaxID=396571 RepID=A0A3L6NDC1_FUSOX|nr:hypothetical protein BFJ65_g9475 [Fusarium oxysporum f. sp. cepae]RKK37323.1 hypothetical protein BFJ66_g13036 [Fusarium oxysporum f. sp. cepae]
MRVFLGGYQYYVNPTWHVTDWKKQGEGISMLIKTENTQDVVGCKTSQGAAAHLETITTSLEDQRAGNLRG